MKKRKSTFSENVPKDRKIYLESSHLTMGVVVVGVNIFIK